MGFNDKSISGKQGCLTLKILHMATRRQIFKEKQLLLFFRFYYDGWPLDERNFCTIQILSNCNQRCNDVCFIILPRNSKGYPTTDSMLESVLQYVLKISLWEPPLQPFGLRATTSNLSFWRESDQDSPQKKLISKI